MAPIGWKFINLAVFSHFWTILYLQKLPAVPGAIMRGPKNRFLGLPATKKVPERLLKSPKTTHNTMGPYLGVHGAPWVRQKQTLRISPFSSKICLTKLPKVLRDRLPGNPKLVYGGPCTQKSAGRPCILSQDTTQSLWDPTVGSPGHPGSRKSQLGKISLFSSQICPIKRARRRAQRVFTTPKPACGGPCGQKSAGRPSILSQDTT